MLFLNFSIECFLIFLYVAGLEGVNPQADDSYLVNHVNDHIDTDLKTEKQDVWKKEIPVANIKKPPENVPTIVLKNFSFVSKGVLNHTSTANLSKINEPFKKKSEEIESGAMTRAILLFGTIGLIFILYVGFRTYRQKNRCKKRTVVKYGVRARQNDIEMEPLPLSDDEEDETVFDLTAKR